eukprot:TRINITY_DN1026_c0_g2_i1.p1 TRINITY_DN1026_c0_g2~~TRINITY_DN1026_c0_g2_i1.p1  ORF type:complete len:162 (+),score=38.66 TRINITY_DN1026_c0_g2_i1:59-487(+)
MYKYLPSDYISRLGPWNVTYYFAKFQYLYDMSLWLFYSVLIIGSIIFLVASFKFLKRFYRDHVIVGFEFLNYDEHPDSNVGENRIINMLMEDDSDSEDDIEDDSEEFDDVFDDMLINLHHDESESENENEIFFRPDWDNDDE